MEDAGPPELTFTKQDLIKLFEWFNYTQWRGGKGDPVKVLFCQCDYPKLVDQALKELKMK
jgi:hypothetical protein